MVGTKDLPLSLVEFSLSTNEVSTPVVKSKSVTRANEVLTDSSAKCGSRSDRLHLD